MPKLPRSSCRSSTTARPLIPIGRRASVPVASSDGTRGTARMREYDPMHPKLLGGVVARVTGQCTGVGRQKRCLSSPCAHAYAAVRPTGQPALRAHRRGTRARPSRARCSPCCPRGRGAAVDRRSRRQRGSGRTAAARSPSPSRTRSPRRSSPGKRSPSRSPSPSPSRSRSRSRTAARPASSRPPTRPRRSDAVRPGSRSPIRNLSSRTTPRGRSRPTRWPPPAAIRRRPPTPTTSTSPGRTPPSAVSPSPTARCVRSSRSPPRRPWPRQGASRTPSPRPRGAGNAGRGAAAGAAGPS